MRVRVRVRVWVRVRGGVRGRGRVRVREVPYKTDSLTLPFLISWAIGLFSSLVFTLG